MSIYLRTFVMMSAIILCTSCDEGLEENSRSATNIKSNDEKSIQDKDDGTSKKGTGNSDENSLSNTTEGQGEETIENSVAKQTQAAVESLKAVFCSEISADNSTS